MLLQRLLCAVYGAVCGVAAAQIASVCIWSIGGQRYWPNNDKKFYLIISPYLIV